MKRNKVIFFVIAVVSIIIAGTILFLSNGKKDLGNTTVSTNQGDGEKLVLNIIGQTGSGGGFFENARKDFIAKNNNIDINYIGLGTFEAIDYINKENDVDAWLCADETGLDMLKDTYAKEHSGKEIVVDSASIVASPLVLVGWEERLNKLGDLTINSLYDMIAQGKTWQAVGGQADWGFVNFSHTDPIKSNSGVQFITLLTHNFYSKNNMPKKSLAVEDIANDKLVEYIKAFEKNTAKQEEGSGKFMEFLVLYGPSRYDMGAIYEYYALTNIKNAKGRWGNLKIIYPSPTIWSNRPFIILNGSKASKEKIEACKKFQEYLLSNEVQQKAMLEGFRPASQSVTDLSYLANEYSKYGFKKDIPAAVPAPDSKVIESIQAMIQRIK